jgi:hypothetical protein
VILSTNVPLNPLRQSEWCTAARNWACFSAAHCVGSRSAMYLLCSQYCGGRIAELPRRVLPMGVVHHG